MERLVEDPLPAIEEAAGDIEMAMVGIEETAAAVATGDIGAAVASGVAAAGEIAGAGAALPAIALATAAGSIYEWISTYENGRRKRKRVTTDRAPDASRPAPPRRGPYLPRPRKAGPDRRNFGPTDVPGDSMPPKKPTGGKKRKAGKVLRRKSTTKRSVKRKTSSKKKTKKKKSVSYALTQKQEVHGVFKRKAVSYFGFQATAGMEEIFRAAADSVLRAVLKKAGIAIRRTDIVTPVVASVPQMSRMKIYYQRTKYSDGTDGGAASGGAEINFTTGTYESKVNALAVELEGKVRDGYYPYYYETLTSTGSYPANVVGFSYKLGDSKLNLSVKRHIKLRNITKSDAGTNATDTLDTNPIQGRLYKFRHDVPRTNTTVYQTDKATFAKFHDRICTAGVIFGPQRNASGDHDGTLVDPTGIMGTGKVLSSPPPGGRVWDNLSSSKKIGLAPGQAAVHKMAFKFTGTLRQFLSKYAASEYSEPSIGYCHLFGFEQKFKTDQNDIINVEYDCDDVIKAGMTFVREDVTPPSVRTIHAHSSTFD